MTTIGEVALTVWLIVAEFTALAVFTLPILKQALPAVVTIGVTQATRSILASIGRRFLHRVLACKAI